MTIENLTFYEDKDQPMARMHFGMFLAWAIARGYVTEDWADDLRPVVEARKKRPSVLTDAIDKLGAEELTEAVGAFATTYYGRAYFYDVEDEVWAKAGLFSRADSWKSFDRLAVVLDQRLAAFQSARSG